MTDYFQLLDLPRSPWLNPAEVKDRFSELSAPVHPDRVHQADDATRKEANDRYAELNKAAQTLSGSKLRLRHLIELETGEAPSEVGNVPSHISDLFFEVGQVFRTTNAVIKEREEATSPIVQAQVMRKTMDESEKLKALIEKLNHSIRELDRRCERLNESWKTKDATRPLDELGKLYRDYSYLTKWLVQANEKQLQLTL